MREHPNSGSIWRKFPIFTVLFLLVMVGANSLAGSIHGPLPVNTLETWGIAHHRLFQGEAWRLITSTFLSHDSGMFLRQFSFAAGVIGYCEYRFGAWKTAALLLTIDVLGVILLLVLVIGPLSNLPYPVMEGIAVRHDVGMSAGGFGLVGVIIGQSRRPWTWFTAAFILLAGKLVFWPDIIADTAHILTLVMGFALQYLVFDRRDPDSSRPN